MNPGEAVSYELHGEEVFRVVLQFEQCAECGSMTHGLVVAGVKGLWWICGMCNAFNPATLKAQPARSRKGARLHRVK